MTNVGEERLFFFSGSVHDRGLYLECVILIALKKILLQVLTVI